MTSLHSTSDKLDFDDDTWDEICLARLRYNAGVNKRAWWRVLRTYCGYTGGNYAMMHSVSTAVDTWLAAHPSWKGKYLG